MDERRGTYDGRRLYHSWTALFVEIFGEHEVAKLDLLQRALLRDDIRDMCHAEPSLAGLLDGQSPEWAAIIAAKLLRDRIGGSQNLLSYAKTLRPERPHSGGDVDQITFRAFVDAPGRTVLPPSISNAIAADLDGPLSCEKCGVGIDGPDMAGSAGHLFTCPDHPDNDISQAAADANDAVLSGEHHTKQHPPTRRYWKTVYVEADTQEEADALMLTVDKLVAVTPGLDMDTDWDEVEEDWRTDEEIEEDRLRETHCEWCIEHKVVNCRHMGM